MDYKKANRKVIYMILAVEVVLILLLILASKLSPQN